MMNTILSIYWTLSSLLNIIILSLSNTILSIYGPSSSAYIGHYPLYTVNTILSLSVEHHPLFLLNTILYILNTILSLYWIQSFLFNKHHFLSLLKTILSPSWTPFSLFIEHHPVSKMNTTANMAMQRNDDFTTSSIFYKSLGRRNLFSGLTDSEQHTNLQSDLITLHLHVFPTYFQVRKCICCFQYLSTFNLRSWI